MFVFFVWRTSYGCGFKKVGLKLDGVEGSPGTGALDQGRCGGCGPT